MKDNNKEMTVQEKKELESQKEQTTPLKRYVPATDIVETENELVLYLDMPGVDKEHIKVKLEKNVLKINGEIQMNYYKELKPVYTEYNVGNYTRQFELSNKIDQEKISATMADGVLSLVLPKVPELQPRTIQIN
jgi:HSP20 family protein